MTANISFRHALIFAGLLPAVSLFAEQEKVAPALASAPATPIVAEMSEDSLKALSREELRTLIQLSSLPPEKLAALRQSIEHLEKMKPEDKLQLRARLEKLHNANEKERARFFREANERRFRNNLLVRYWSSLPPEQAKAEQAGFRAMNDEARRAYVEMIKEKLPQRSHAPDAREQRQGWPPPPRPQKPPAESKGAPEAAGPTAR